MGAPIVYRYDDAGAPVISNGQDAFYQILKACLVDGFGSHPAAGWSVVYDQWATIGHASFTNAGESGVLGVVRAGTTNYPPFLYVAEAMVDASTPVGARSGEYDVTSLAFVEGSSETTQRPVQYYQAYRYWIVVANENWAWVWMSAYPTLVGVSYNTSVIGVGACRHLRGLGSISAPEPGNFFIVGGANTSRILSTSNYAYLYNSNLGYNYCSTAFYGSDGARISGRATLAIWPFFQYQRESNTNGIGETGGSLIELPLHPASLFLLTPTKSYTRYADQIAVLPGLLTNAANCWPDEALSEDVGNMFTAVTYNGLPVMPAALYYNFALVSLAAGDWQ